jgi:hypothetical protein
MWCLARIQILTGTRTVELQRASWPAVMPIKVLRASSSTKPTRPRSSSCSSRPRTAALRASNPAVLEAADDAYPATLVVALRSSMDSSVKGVVDAYGVAPVTTTAARDAAFLAVFIGGKLVGGSRGRRRCRPGRAPVVQGQQR